MLAKWNAFNLFAEWNLSGMQGPEIYLFQGSNVYRNPENPSTFLCSTPPLATFLPKWFEDETVLWWWVLMAWGLLRSTKTSTYTTAISLLCTLAAFMTAPHGSFKRRGRQTWRERQKQRASLYTKVERRFIPGINMCPGSSDHNWTKAVE